MCLFEFQKLMSSLLCQMGGGVLRDMTENTGVKCWEGAAHVTCEGGNSWETQVKALNMQCTPKHPLPHPHPSKWWWLNDNYIIHTESMDTTRGLWRCQLYQLYITEVFEQRYDMEEDNRHGVVDSPIVCYQSPVMMVELVTAGVIHSTFLYTVIQTQIQIQIQHHRL